MYNTYTYEIIQVGLVNIYLRMSKTTNYEKWINYKSPKFNNNNISLTYL